MSIFSERLKICRRQIATQKEMAERLGITERGFQNYELGRSQPTYEMLVEIADILNVSVDYLLGRTNDPKFTPSS